MTEQPSAAVRAQAELAGLSLALSQFPGDVAAAAAAAKAAMGALKRPSDPVAEPWPPMRTGIPA